MAEERLHAAVINKAEGATIFAMDTSPCRDFPGFDPTQ
jgi:hypothetical protein